MSRATRLRLAMAGLHPDRRTALVERLGSPARLLRSIQDGEVTVSRRAREAVARDAKAIQAILGELGVRPVFCGDGDYPAKLAGLPDAPDVLFARGRIPEGPAVALVGTRTGTGYGRALASAYGAAVADAGWVVVSGLARGVDAAAHRGMLAAGGRGIAVLGSGSNVVYPADNRDIHDSIVAGGGAVLTEYPPGTPPEAWRFPPRNRIIAGLSAAVVVIEAAETGGALITAAAALEQGRQVLAVPGDVDRASSRGCNLLIRDGAVPVLEPEDLIEALSLILGPAAPRRPGPEPPEPLSDRVLLGLLGPVGRSLEELSSALGRPAEDLMPVVARLEASGRIGRQGGLLQRNLSDR